MITPGGDQDLGALLGEDVDPDTVVDHIAVGRAGPVAVVSLCRPEHHNALSLASWVRLRSVFVAFAAERDLRTVVVRGVGGRAFAAGADISEFPDVRLTSKDAIGYNEAIAAALESVIALRVPVIAMIGGLAVGGGCELAAACDVRIACSDARFGIPIGRLGVTLGYTEANALVRLIGAAALKHLLFSGRLIPADEALRLGLVQQVVDRQELVSETTSLVETIVSSSEVTIRAAKLVADMCGRPLSARDTEELTRITIEAYDGPDLKEGVAAFEARRRPDFTQQRRTTGGRA
jgi:enoyl-CoA hydratase